MTETKPNPVSNRGRPRLEETNLRATWRRASKEYYKNHREKVLEKAKLMKRLEKLTDARGVFQ